MAAPYDIDPKNASFTKDEMKLRKKGGWSKQYSAAIAGNTGFNRWWHNRLADQFTPGSNPAPLEDGANVSGGFIFAWDEFNNSVQTVDTSIDWRDRPVFFRGQIYRETGDNSGLLPGGTGMYQIGGSTFFNEQTNVFDWLGNNAHTASGPVFASAYTGQGNDTLANTKIWLYLRYVDSTGATKEFAFGAKTNGDLVAKVITPNPITGKMVIAGRIGYEAQLGHGNVNQ